MPISLITWYEGKWAGIIFSILSSIFWFSIDYYARPPDPNVWIMLWDALLRFGFFLVTTGLLSELNASLKRERRLARRDHLTQAWNRFAFTEMAEIELARAHRYGHPISLSYIDLDNFKLVNDHHGHAVGDMLLKEIVEKITALIRKTDILGRIGGDEFALLLPETPGET
jgi:hypothetical protein